MDYAKKQCLIDEAVRNRLESVTVNGKTYALPAPLSLDTPEGMKMFRRQLRRLYVREASEHLEYLKVLDRIKGVTTLHPARIFGAHHIWTLVYLLEKMHVYYHIVDSQSPNCEKRIVIEAIYDESGKPWNEIDFDLYNWLEAENERLGVEAYYDYEIELDSDKGIGIPCGMIKPLCNCGIFGKFGNEDTGYKYYFTSEKAKEVFSRNRNRLVELYLIRPLTDEECQPGAVEEVVADATHAWKNLLAQIGKELA